MKLKNNRLLLWTIGLLLCVLAVPSTKLPEGIDERVRTYVEDFEYYGKLVNGPEFEMPSINIGVGDISDIDFMMLSPNVIGICYSFTNPPTVIIKESYWNNASYLSREMTVFHELGHCVLRRYIHNTTLDPYGEPVSLMYPSLFYEGTYFRKRWYYIKELFKPI